MSLSNLIVIFVLPMTVPPIIWRAPINLSTLPSKVTFVLLQFSKDISNLPLNVNVCSV
jgi:hypothetical protein